MAKGPNGEEEFQVSDDSSNTLAGRTCAFDFLLKKHHSPHVKFFSDHSRELFFSVNGDGDSFGPSPGASFQNQQGNLVEWQ